MSLSEQNQNARYELETDTLYSPLVSRIFEMIRDRVRLLAVLTLLFTATGFLGGSHWIIELTSHFRLQYLAASLVCWIGLLAFRDWHWSHIGLLCVLLNGGVVLPWYFGSSSEKLAPGGQRIRVMLANVLTSNRNTSAVRELIGQESPDILALQEIDAHWVAELKALKSRFWLPVSDSGLLLFHACNSWAVQQVFSGKAHAI